MSVSMSESATLRRINRRFSSDYYQRDSVHWLRVRKARPHEAVEFGDYYVQEVCSGMLMDTDVDIFALDAEQRGVSPPE